MVTAPWWTMMAQYGLGVSSHIREAPLVFQGIMPSIIRPIIRMAEVDMSILSWTVPTMSTWIVGTGICTSIYAEVDGGSTETRTILMDW